MNEPDEACAACGKPLFDGDAVHTARRVHWDCLPEHIKNPPPDPTIAEIEAIAARCDAAFARLREKLRR